MKKITDFFNTIKKMPLVLKIILVVLVVVLAWLLYKKFKSQGKSQPQYQTAQAEKGTLVTSISASGVISSGSSTTISTKASGIIKKVYVKNGQTVTKGQKIAELTLDDDAQARQTIAWASYISAVNDEKTAQAEKLNTDIQMWKARQAIFDALDDVDYKNGHATNPDTKKDYTDSEKMIIDKTVDYAKKSFEAAETAYKNSDAAISKAQAQVTSAWQSYLQSSGTITAPSAGVISNFTLSPGVTINASTSTANATTTITAQTIGSVINPNAQFQATVNLTELDVIKVKPEQKVVLTLDAFPDKTFSGKVLSVDTNGQTSSGVTNYPTTIIFDPTEINIYPKMAVTAKIITNVTDNVIIVPSTAIQTANNQSSVRIMKEGKVSSVSVETGESNDTQTAILSGINEGDTIVTSVINQ
ncbi:MAG: HlyD family efflux transporter periplasmic adaptor subunit, partial [Patescibacteria group bacterium]|nr:HlyD family efflux transporter periplasmic adaptor subunit [Patescibacteria group bacterium]